MKISCQFKVQGTDKGLCTLSPSSLTSSLKLPKEWTWFWIEKPTPILCIQDYVHVAVKLKSRLLKPSVILPMGQYLAGSHHLKILVDTFAKDQHGIRQKDLSHKDKQNFDAVTRITSLSVLKLLEKFPDAKGTLKYLQLLRNFMDAFLDKCLLPLERIKKVWNAIFLLRYWHRWLCLNKKFTVRENFITSNANCGVELNGHALIILLILMRDVIPNGNELFCPWLLGSQPCEQTFRAARSMTGTFSTIINFSMYGLLNRLHRLQIQLQLESEMHETGIKYPRVTRHIKKSGFSAETMLPNLKEISNEDICDAVQSARADAISTLEDLGIFVKDKDGKWEDLTVKIVNNKHDDDDDDDNERDNEDEDEDTMEERKNSEKDCSEIVNEDLEEDVSALKKAGLVDRQLFERVRMKRILSNTISLYSPDEEADTKQNNCHQKKHSEFIPVSHNNKTVYIRKSTAIWLLQEFEHVSSDRLFRVRTKQPNSSEFQVNLSEKQLTVVKSLPQKCEVINIGDVCVFQKYRCGEWKIGKVLQFFYHSGKTPKAQQCKQTSMKFISDDTNNVSVVCTWFIWHAPLSLWTFVISPSSTSHHCVINEYAFTLTEGCFELQQMEDCEADGSIIAQHSNRLKLACSYILIISEESMQFLEENLKRSDDECYVTEAEDCSLNIVGPGKGNGVWKKYGCYQLTVQHRSQLLGNHLLCDIHIGAAQALIHRQFPAIGGLQNTVLQYSKSLQPFAHQQNIQIVHVILGRIHHWVVVSTVGCKKDEIEVYDSLQMQPNLYTRTVIAQYLRSQSHSFKIKVANVATQKGSTDCGLYAIAMMTSLAYNENPSNLIYNQQDMRIHLEQCFEKGILEKFPFSKTRRVTKQFSSETDVAIYCKCRLPDPEDGSKMIQCDNCQEWYHMECVKLDPQQPTTDIEWFCEKCQP